MTTLNKESKALNQWLFQKPLTCEDTLENNTVIRETALALGIDIMMSLDRTHYHVVQFGVVKLIKRELVVSALNALTMRGESHES